MSRPIDDDDIREVCLGKGCAMEEHDKDGEIDQLRAEVGRLAGENALLQKQVRDCECTIVNCMYAIEEVLRQQSVMTDWATHSLPLRAVSKASKRAFAQHMGEKFIDESLWHHEDELCSYIYSQYRINAAIQAGLQCDHVGTVAYNRLLLELSAENLGRRVFVYDVSEIRSWGDGGIGMELVSYLGSLGYLCVGLNVCALEMVSQEFPHVFHVGSYSLFVRLLNLAFLCGKETISMGQMWAGMSPTQEVSNLARSFLEQCGVCFPHKQGDSYPIVSIIILSWNNISYTQNCLLSILENSGGEDYEIIVVDNASTDGTVKALEQYQSLFDNFVLIKNDENLGFPAGNNIGLRVARGDYLVLLNNDTYVTAGWLEHLRKHMEAHKNLGMVGPLAYIAANKQQYTVCSDEPSRRYLDSFAASIYAANKGRLVDADMLQFFCTMISREAFEKVGFLDESFGLGVCEDDDYSARMKAAGYRIACAQDVFIRHFHRRSFSLIDEDVQEKNLQDSIARYVDKYGEAPKAFRDYPTQ